MWTGPLWDRDVAGRMTQERAVAVCSASQSTLDAHRKTGLVWSDADREYAERELRRSVRYIAEAADLMSREHTLYHMDDLPNMAGTGRLRKWMRSLQRFRPEAMQQRGCPTLTPSSSPMPRLKT